MEKYQNEEIILAAENLAKVIRNSEEYQRYIKLKDKMEKNKTIKELTTTKKKLQQQYVKSAMLDESIALEMKKCDEVLNNIPLYVEYNGVLEALNSITSMITDGLNEEFQKLLNKKEGINNE